MSLEQTCLRAGRVLKCISLLCSDSHCGDHAGNDNFHQVLDTPLNLQAFPSTSGVSWSSHPPKGTVRNG